MSAATPCFRCTHRAIDHLSGMRCVNPKCHCRNFVAATHPAAQRTVGSVAPSVVRDAIITNIREGIQQPVGSPNYTVPVLSVAVLIVAILGILNGAPVVGVG